MISTMEPLCKRGSVDGYEKRRFRASLTGLTYTLRGEYEGHWICSTLLARSQTLGRIYTVL